MMQYRNHILALAMLVVFSTAAEGQSYPWRSGSSVGSQVKTAPSTPRAQRRANRSGVMVSFRQDQEQAADDLVDRQPSVSDVVVPPDANVPAAPGSVMEPQIIEAPSGGAPIMTPQNSLIQPGMVNQDWASPEPGLMVTSNAGDEPNYCNRNCHTGCNLGCERKLFGQTPGGLELGGWFNVGYHNRDNGLFNNHKGDVLLHQLWLYADRQADRTSDAWAFGYRTDLIYGVDGPNLQAFGNSPTGAPSGWDNSWDYGSWGWAMPQAYVQVANCNWDVKIGKFLSPFGYESVAARDNFFYSHSFARVLTQPYSMTGVLGERNLGAGRSVLLGATAGWDTGFENNSGGNLIVGARRQLNEFVNVGLTASVGDTGYRDTGIYTSGVTQVQLTDQLRYVLQTDVLNLGDNQEFGLGQYLIRDINACLGLGARLEWWKSDRYFGGPNRSTYNFTMGANYRFNANVRIRPELRFDWGALAVDPGQPIIGVDAVVTF